MSRSFVLRSSLGNGALVLMAVALASPALAVGIDSYHQVRSFSLPAPNGLSGGNVLFDALPDGRLLLLNGATVSVETSPAAGVFATLGDIPGFAPGFGPSFLSISPDGTRAAAGSNGGGSVVVFNTGNPAVVSSYAMPDFAGEWIDDARLAVSANSGVQVLDTASSTVKPVITGIGGFTGGVTFDAAGTLYASNGFSLSGPSGTGWIKAFPAAAWEAALASNAPLDFETSGTPIADLLSASPVGFDSLGNLFVAGGDFFGSSGDFGYAALVHSEAVDAAMTNPSVAPPINTTSPGAVLRKFASPQDTIDNFQAPNWNYNAARGELYLSYLFAGSEVTVYAVPEPAAWALAVLVPLAVACMRRSRSRQRSAVVAASGAGALLAWLGTPITSTASPYATEIVATTPQFGNSSIYNNPAAVLGEPARLAVNSDPLGGDSYHVSVLEPAYNRDSQGNNLLTTLARRLVGGSYEYGSITVKFDHPVVDDAANPYGIDLNVFGNAFFIHSGTVGDDSDLRSHELVGGVYAEPVVVSVSPDNVNWYTYAAGPYGDTAFPTQGYQWSAAQFDATGNGWTTTNMDFTKPVNPTLSAVLGVVGQNLSAADAIGAYVGAGGGTGFDLAASPFDWIQYVRVESTAQSHGGEIDAFADVQPTRLGDALAITPANVVAGTSLYFQNPEAPTQTAVLANFTAVSDLARLSTATVADAAALAALDALTGESLLASYQLDVSPLIGATPVTYAADFNLQPGANYAGDGSDLSLLQWDGEDWNAVAFEFDASNGLARLEDWNANSSTLAIMQTATHNPGDHNDDGMVDGADFLVWQRELSSSGLEDWKTNFGEGAGASVTAAIVPEPSVAMMSIVALGSRWLWRRA